MPRVLKLEDVKPILGNLSRANYFQVQFGGMSVGLYDHLRRRGVNSQFIADDLGILCYGAAIPGSSLASVESTNYHGVVENFAHTKIYSSLSLDFYSDSEYRAMKFLEHWMEYAVSGNGIDNQFYASKFYTHRMQYPDDPTSGYKSESTKMYKFEPNVQRVLEYSFFGLFPKSLSSVPVSYGSGAGISKIKCEFKYDRYIAGSTYSYDNFRGLGNNLSNVLDTVNNVFSVANQAIDVVSDIGRIFN